MFRWQTIDLLICNIYAAAIFSSRHGLCHNESLVKILRGQSWKNAAAVARATAEADIVSRVDLRTKLSGLVSVGLWPESVLAESRSRLTELPPLYYHSHVKIQLFELFQHSIAMKLRLCKLRLYE